MHASGVVGVVEIERSVKSSDVFTEEVRGTEVCLVQHVDLAICAFNHEMMMAYSTALSKSG